MLPVLMLLCLGASARAQYGQQPAVESQQGQPAALRDVGLDQRLNEQIPPELAFRDETGRQVVLGNYFAGKPVILVLIQLRCPMLCNQVLNGLVAALRKVPFHAGQEFEVVAVSFDARETPELAAEKKARYVESYGISGSESGWHFLTGTQDSIDRLTRAAGFRYTYDPKANQFAHASGILVLTPKGRVSRYFYGIDYSPRDLRLGLVEASESRIGSKVDQLLLFCFHYDAARGKYSATALGFVRLGGVLTLLALGAFVVVAWRRERRKRSAAGG
jgi:protein SCO1/2